MLNIRAAAPLAAVVAAAVGPICTSVMAARVRAVQDSVEPFQNSPAPGLNRSNLAEHHAAHECRKEGREDVAACPLLAGPGVDDPVRVGDHLAAVP
jgi:hypothetical protein